MAWPGRAEVVNYTIVVFVTLVLVTAVVFGLDYVFAKAVILLFGTNMSPQVSRQSPVSRRST